MGDIVFYMRDNQIYSSIITGVLIWSLRNTDGTTSYCYMLTYDYMEIKRERVNEPILREEYLYPTETELLADLAKSVQFRR